MKVIYDLFDISMHVVPFKEKPLSKRRMIFSGTMEINPIRKNTTSRGNSLLKKVERMVETT